MAQTPRKKYTISPNLKIPPTISTPQEGLPQLAAEVTCHPRNPHFETNFLGDMSLLVREFDYPEAGARNRLATPADAAPRPRRTSYNWIPEMGSNHLDHHAGCSKCHSFGTTFHLQAEAD
jgi:hypothetical protein